MDRGWGLFGGHLIDVLCYRFGRVPEMDQSHALWRQAIGLLRFWDGWRSVGGLFGALAATLLWKRYRFESTVIARLAGVFELEGYWFVRRRERLPLLALADVVLSVFPLAWALHRVGSALAFDRSELRLLDLLITTTLLAAVAMLWKGRFRVCVGRNGRGHTSTKRRFTMTSSAAGADTAFYIGDDETDEDVFRLDESQQLFTVRVRRSKKSGAQFYLREQREIDVLLTKLVEFRVAAN